MASLRFVAAARFPYRRFRAQWRLGQWLLGPATAVGPEVVRLEPQEQRALLEFTLDETVDKLGLGPLKDLLDVARIPAWNRKVDNAFRVWQEATMRYGSSSPQARTAYGSYLETMIFRMPFFGTKAEALLSLLKILGRMNPME